MVNTGVKNSSDFGRVISWNGMTALDKWKDPTCNAINGTDGMLFAPFITKEKNLDFVIPMMCRSLRFVYTETVDHDGVACFRYKMAPETFQGVSLAPSNWCFCADKNISNCDINGVFSLAACAEGTNSFLFPISKINYHTSINPASCDRLM